MNAHFLDDYVKENESRLIPDQLVAYDAILDSVNGNEDKFFFIDGPAGTGKTFLINLLLARVRSRGQTAIPVASTGMAATLLRDGTTAHSTFILPLNNDPQEHQEAIDNIRRNEARVNLFRKAVIVFWDQCSMTNRVHLETANTMLNDIRLSSDIMVGGLTFVLSGDFRQILPVICGGTREDVVTACLKNSTIWPRVQILSLGTNMRARLSLDPRADEFASLLLDVGNGTVQFEGDCIELNEGLGVRVTTLDDLIRNVYPDIENLNTKSDQWLCERMIVSPKNEDVDEINWELLGRYQSELRMFNLTNDADNFNYARYTQEYLNSLNPHTLPPHRLLIKIGAPVMLLWNWDPPRLCNGTRLRVTGFGYNTIKTTILTGPGTGQTADIPMISINSSYKNMPVKTCFAITIHKAQGQSFGCIGVDLRKPCNDHGQLYVALSRVGKKDEQFILLPFGNGTSNIVYPKVLTHE